MNPLDLTNMTILVTGASNGIGRATAIYLSRLGARIIAVGRNEQRLQETLAMLAVGDHHSRVKDLADVEVLPAWLKALAKDVGPLHGLVHSAGISLRQPLRGLSYSDYSLILRINLDAAVMLSKGFRQKGVRAETGSSIVYLSSVSALKATPALAAYGASKGALLSLTRTLSHELAADNIRVNCLCPGLVDTDMLEGLRAILSEEQFQAMLREYPLGIGKPDDVAYSVAFLLAPGARWITGTVLVIDGGYSA